jgi:monoamine oxidase
MLKVTEAASFLISSKTKEYRRECLDYWKKLHGDKYADEVERMVIKIWKGRKNG